MDSFELLYIANKELKDKIGSDQENARFLKFSANSNKQENELIKRYTAKIEVNMDWVEAIEQGLVFIEKAIREERQFIRNDGDVVPIEKIRKTTTASIRDLAKHSNYITHEAEPGSPTDVMPDKMLQVKKENDYGVYENRVVYATLVYLKDFISSRLTKIREAATKFEADSIYKKKIDIGNNKVSFEFKMHTIKLNDRGLNEGSEIIKILDRLDNCMALVMAFLKTPLMLEVAKVDLVKRPITKTNVLRMNRNFRESLALFDYIANYQGDGYTIENKERIFNPFSKDTTDDFALAMRSLMFASYMHGSEREKYYAAKYQEYLEKKKREEEELTLQKLKSIELKAGLEGKTIVEYVQALQEGTKILERKIEELYGELETIHDKYKAQIQELNDKYQAQIQKMMEEFEAEKISIIDRKEAEKQVALAEKDEIIKNNEIKYNEQLASVKTEYEQRLTWLRDTNKDTVDTLTANYESQISNLKAEQEAAINSFNAEKQAVIDENNAKTKAIIDENNAKTQAFIDESTANQNKFAKEMNDMMAQLEEKDQALVQELTEVKEENDLLNAKVTTYETQLKINTVPKDVDAKMFADLERQRAAFEKYYNKAWSNAKRAILRRIWEEPNEIERKKKEEKARKKQEKLAKKQAKLEKQEEVAPEAIPPMEEQMTGLPLEEMPLENNMMETPIMEEPTQTEKIKAPAMEENAPIEQEPPNRTTTNRRTKGITKDGSEKRKNIR